MSSFLAELLIDLIVDGVGALIRKQKDDAGPPGYTVPPSWECPACGTWNPACKGICENCGEGKPRSGKTMA